MEKQEDKSNQDALTIKTKMIINKKQESKERNEDSREYS